MSKGQSILMIVGLAGMCVGAHAGSPLDESKPHFKVSEHIRQLGRPASRAQESGRISRSETARSQPRPTPAVVAGETVPLAGEYFIFDAIAEDAPEELAAELEALGAQHCRVAGNLVSGWMPCGAIAQLEGVASLRFMRPAAVKFHAGSTTTQGDIAQRSDRARSLYAVQGRGVRVGILSDSFNALGGVTAGQIAGDLPQDIQILQDSSGATDEGRAMGEIIHDVAPGASLAFHTAYGGQAGFASGIRALRDAGCRVIVDDVLYLEEPMFADGVVAQAVQDVAASGVAYFSAAGNAGRSAHESVYRDAGDGCHDFNPSPTATDTVMNMNLFGGVTYFVLQWQDGYASLQPGQPGAATDLDLELTDRNGASLGLGSSDNNLGNDPIEQCSIKVTTFASEVGVRIRRKAGPVPAMFRLLWYSSTLSGPKEYGLRSPTLFGHMNARDAMAVGAARYCKTPVYGTTPALLEAFSSAGPTPIFTWVDGSLRQETRFKPDFVAPQGGNNSFFGSDNDCDPLSVDSKPNFFGTSAAAPHAAGLAALMFEARPGSTPAHIRRAFQATALDMGVAGPDYDSGYGLIQGDAALGHLLRTPPQLRGVVSRRVHGASGAYDLPLSLSSGTSIECRRGSSLSLIFNFDRPVAKAGATVAAGVANVASATVNGALVTVNLTGVANGQWLTVVLNGVEDAAGAFCDPLPVHFGMLCADVNADGRVDATDAGLIAGGLSKTPSIETFRCDVDASGWVNYADLYPAYRPSIALLP